jgi:hypothetical protein
VLKVLDAFDKSGSSGSSRFINSTQHWTQKYYSRFYNWKAGSWKGAYGRQLAYVLRRGVDADEAMRLLASFYAPLFESLLAEGIIIEYEIDREQVYGYSADSAGRVIMAFVTPTADSSKVGKALTAAYEKSPLILTVLSLAKARAFVNEEDADFSETVRVDAVYR